MKVRNYEKKDFIIFLSILIFIVLIIFFIVLFNTKDNKYIKVSSIVIKDNLVLVVVSKNTRKTIYSNKVLYLNDSLKKYKIVEDRGVVLKKNNKNYYELVLEVDFKNKKVNDILELVIKYKKFRLIEIFKLIWEGD